MTGIEKKLIHLVDQMKVPFLESYQIKKKILKKAEEYSCWKDKKNEEINPKESSVMFVFT